MCSSWHDFVRNFCGRVDQVCEDENGVKRATVGAQDELQKGS